MVRPPPPQDDDIDEPLEPPPARKAADPRRRPAVRRSTDTGPTPVRAWRSSSDGEEPWDDDLDDDRRERRPVFWRARDSLYFEPLVALAIIAVLLVALFAYTSNWPPVYVVESNSMQHGSGDHLGVLNAGDIVLAQKTDSGSIVPYVQGVTTGFSTYGLYGDVILYYPNGSTSLTPIIHRAIIFLQYDPHSDSYNATGLSPNECYNGTSGLYATPQSPGGCATTGLTPSDELILYHVGGRTVTVDFSVLYSAGSTHSGFLTLGDNNSKPDQVSGLSTLVEPGWVIGVARGLIPWFGALKLLLDGNSGRVPDASWEFLGITVAGVIFAAAGIHLLLRRGRAGRERPANREVEAEDEEDREAPPVRHPVIERAPVRAWRAAPPPDPTPAPAAEGGPRRMSYEQRRRSHFVTSREQQAPRRRRPGQKTGDDSEES